MLDNRYKIIDVETILNNSSETLATSSAGSVDAVDKVVDTGGGYTKGMFIVDSTLMSGVGTAADNRAIDIKLEGSNTAEFTAWVRLAGFRFGVVASHTPSSWAGQSDSSAASASTGRFMTPFHNDYNGTIYRYLRAYVQQMGTGATPAQVKYAAYLSK